MIKATKDLGIWMDHSNAYLTEFKADIMSTKILTSAYTHQEKVSSMNKSEALAHHKEQKEQAAYYNEICETILKYNRIILFGPTDAKLELRNILKANHHFDKIVIDVENADKMSEHEQQLFVKAYFSNQ